MIWIRPAYLSEVGNSQLIRNKLASEKYFDRFIGNAIVLNEILIDNSNF